jgi:hypothetical protein
MTKAILDRLTRPGRTRTIAMWAAGLIALYAILGFLVAPPIVRSQLERALAEQLGRQVTVERVLINPFALSAAVRGFALKSRDGSDNDFAFDELYVDVAASSLLRLAPVVESVRLTKPSARIVRNEDKSYSFQDIVDRFANQPASPPGPTPRFAFYNIQLTDGSFDFDDRPNKTRQVVSDLQIGIPFISSLPSQIDITVQPRLAAKVNGAAMELLGETKPFEDTRETRLRIDIDDLEVAKYFEYVPLRVRITGGTLTTRLELALSMQNERLHTLALSGTAELKNFAALRRDRTPLIAIGALSVDIAALDLVNRRAAIKSVRVESPRVDIVRHKDEQLNLAGLVPESTSADGAKSGPPFSFSVAEIALSRGAVHVLDETTPGQPFRFVLDNVSLSVAGLGNGPEDRAAIRLACDAGKARLAVDGTLAIAPELFVDAKASVKDVDLLPITPYTGKYVGYAVQKGKLSLKVSYFIDQRKVSAENNVYLDQLTFGDKVESATATSLPVLFAVALLKDKDGVIDLNLHVSGSLDDPQFSLRGAFARALESDVDKAVTSPFALIGASSGAGEELAYVEFAPGSSALDAASAQKLDVLAKALDQRPGLKLDVSGRVDPERDRAVLKGAADRETKAAKLDDDLRQLANARAQAARDRLIGQGRLAPDRVFIVAPRMTADGIKDTGKPTRADFSLK